MKLIPIAASPQPKRRAGKANAWRWLSDRSALNCLKRRCPHLGQSEQVPPLQVDHTPGRSNAVKSFIAKHSGKIKGVLECFDRVIIRGHLPMAGVGYFATWLYSKKISLNLQNLPAGWRRFKEMGPQFAEWLKEHAKGLAEGAGRPFTH